MILKSPNFLNESLKGTLQCCGRVELKGWYAAALMIEVHFIFNPYMYQKNSGSHLHLLVASALLLLFPLLQDSCHQFQLSSSAPQQPALLNILVRYSRSLISTLSLPNPPPSLQGAHSPWPLLLWGSMADVELCDTQMHPPLGPALSSHTALWCPKTLKFFCPLFRF